MLTYYENGTAKKTFDIVSGHKGKVPIEASKDEGGSNNPIPQGVFSIGTPEAVKPPDDPKERDPLGRTWISIDTKGYGGRSYIGFHADEDGDGQSQGCVTLKNKGDIGDIANLVNGGARTIIVDHGLKENPVAGVCSPDGTSSETSSAASEDKVKSIAEIRNGLAKSCFGGPVIAFGFAVPMIFGEKLHETFAPYVSGILMIVFAIWAYLKVGSALLPFGPKDQAASLFNAIGVRFFVVLGVAVFLLAPTTGYTAYRDYIVTPILSAGTTIVDKMYDIGMETNPTLAKFAKEDGACTPTPIKGLDAKLTALKDNLECKVCMIQRAYSYPWSYGLFQVGNGKIFTGLLLMLVGIAPFLMFLFTVADVFMVRIGYVSCTLSAYAAAGCFPASRKYAITGLKSLSDGAMVLITSMIAAMISISMLTTVIENLDKGGQGDFAGTGTTATPGSIATGTATPADTVKPQTPFETPKAPKSIPGAPIPGSGGIDLRASNFQTPTTTYATGPMGDGTPNGTYASWYRNTYLQQSPPKNTGFDTFGERALSGSSLGGITLKSPFLGGKSNPVTSPFGLCPGHSNPIHAGLDLGCAMGDPLTPMAPCQVIYAGPAGGYGFVFDCRIMNGSTPSNVVFSYGHLTINSGITQGMIVNSGQVIGTCNTHGFSTGPHLHLEIVVDSPDIPKLYPGNGALSCHSSSRPVGHVAAASSQFGRNAYYVNPEPLLAGAMSLQGVEAAGFSAVATNFKNFGVTQEGWMVIIIICIITVLIARMAQRFTSGQGMGIFMKALGQMITGVIQTLGAMVGVGAKAAEALAPVGGMVGGMAAGAAGQILQSTGLDKAVNRAAEGVQGAMNNVTQGLSGVMDNIGSGISGFVQQSVQAVQTLPITQRAMEFQQGMRDLAAGMASSDFAQGIARVVMPGVAVLTFATKNVALPVAGFVGREILLPAAVDAAAKIATIAGRNVFDPNDDLGLSDVNLAGELQNARENLAKAPLSEAPARDAATRATPAVEQQQGGWVPVENTNPQNDYAVLGVREGATLEEMRAALRQKGRELHPDINPNGGDQFREVTAAFGRLKSRGDVQAATPQEITPETTRALSGTTFAPIPRGQTEDSRAAEESSRRESVAASREALGDYAGGGSYSGGYESRFREEDPEEADNEPTTNESSSNTKPKTEGPANNIVSARGLRDNNKKPDPRQEGMKRAASVAGDGVSANEILAETGIDATEAEMRAAKNNIVRLKRAATPTPTGPKSRR